MVQGVACTGDHGAFSGTGGHELAIFEGSSQKQRPCRSKTTSKSWPASRLHAKGPNISELKSLDFARDFMGWPRTDHCTAAGQSPQLCMCILCSSWRALCSSFVLSNAMKRCSRNIGSCHGRAWGLSQHCQSHKYQVHHGPCCITVHLHPRFQRGKDCQNGIMAFRTSPPYTRICMCTD